MCDTRVIRLKKYETKRYFRSPIDHLLRNSRGSGAQFAVVTKLRAAQRMTAHGACGDLIDWKARYVIRENNREKY